MPVKKRVCINKKYISSPEILEELALMQDESDKKPAEIVYDCFVEKVRERIAKRKVGNLIVQDILSLETLKSKLVGVINEYESNCLLSHKPQRTQNTQP